MEGIISNNTMLFNRNLKSSTYCGVDVRAEWIKRLEKSVWWEGGTGRGDWVGGGKREGRVSGEGGILFISGVRKRQLY